MFRRKPEAAKAPPPLPPSAVPPVSSAPPPVPPPVIPRSPRKHHHWMTHERIPQWFMGEERANYVTMLFHKDLQEAMRMGWRLMGLEFGTEAVPADSLEVSRFQHESCLCCFWEFPTTVAPGESILGLIVAGPSTAWGPETFGKVNVRYFLMERRPQNLSEVVEWTPTGLVSLGPGPAPGTSITAFSDLVFEHLFGKKRPTAAEAARRLLVLKHVVVYAQASTLGKALHQCADLPPAAKADLHAIMGGMFSQTLQQQNLWDDVSPAERLLFETPVQNLSPQQVINASWRSEAIGVLLWALGLLPELPAYDSPFKQETAPKIPEGDIAAFIQSAKLRPEQEIDEARQVAELWHWRSRTRQLVEDKYPYQPTEALKKAGLNTLEDVVRLTAHTAAQDGNIPSCIADDFPVKGKAYRDLSPDEWSEVRSVSAERHFTLNWLCGYAPANQWDRTPTET